MQIGIIGLPRSGKSTVFQALVGGHVADISTVKRRGYGLTPNIAVTHVPDQRLNILAAIFRPQRVIEAEVQYLDFPGELEGKGIRGLEGESLNMLQTCDALLHVIRDFKNPGVDHIYGSVDVFRDVETMGLELILVDLGIVERRMMRLESTMRGAKNQQRLIIENELKLLGKLKTHLESELPLRSLELSIEEEKLYNNFQFLTLKPLLLVRNIEEEDIPISQELEFSLNEKVLLNHTATAVMCGQLEMELSQMEENEAIEFRQELGLLTQSGREIAIRISYALLGLVSFLTVGEDEVRAWTITNGTVALRAAGKIHTDLERGFIRAEVVSFYDLERCGSIASARREGVLRQEGKTYEVKDGDVINFLFNV